MALGITSTVIGGTSRGIITGADGSGNIAAAAVLVSSAGAEIRMPALDTDGGSLCHVTNFPVGSFTPIPGATSALTVGPLATTSGMPLGTYSAAVYRFRNASNSVSPVAWRLNTSASGTAAAAPVPASTSGTGGTVGDKMVDPGGVEVFSLTAAQQTAFAAGSLYLSAITPAGGSATVYFTPGVAGS